MYYTSYDVYFYILFVKTYKKKKRVESKSSESKSSNRNNLEFSLNQIQATRSLREESYFFYSVSKHYILEILAWQLICQTTSADAYWCLLTSADVCKG